MTHTSTIKLLVALACLASLATAQINATEPPDYPTGGVHLGTLGLGLNTVSGSVDPADPFDVFTFTVPPNCNVTAMTLIVTNYSGCTLGGPGCDTGDAFINGGGTGGAVVNGNGTFPFQSLSITGTTVSVVSVIGADMNNGHDYTIEIICNSNYFDPGPGAGPVVLTQSTDNTTPTGAGVSCLAQDQAYYRSYDMNTAVPASHESFEITGVNFGVDDSQTGGAGQPVTVNIYRDTTPGNPAPLADLVLLHSEATVVPDGVTFVHSVVFSSPVRIDMDQCTPTANEIVVEIAVPAGHAFFLGANSAGESASGYIAAAGCGVPEPDTMASVGFPNAHLMIDMVGDYVAHYPGTGEDLINTSPFGFGGNIGGVLPGTFVNIAHESPGGTFWGTRFVVFASTITHPNGACHSPIGNPFPGLHLSFSTAFSIFDSDAFPFYQFGLQPQGFSYGFTYPGGAAGVRTIFQCVVLDSALPANNIFASTDGLAVDFL